MLANPQATWYFMAAQRFSVPWLPNWPDSRPNPDRILRCNLELAGNSHLHVINYFKLDAIVHQDGPPQYPIMATWPITRLVHVPDCSLRPHHHQREAPGPCLRVLVWEIFRAQWCPCGSKAKIAVNSVKTSQNAMKTTTQTAEIIAKCNESDGQMQCET